MAIVPTSTQIALLPASSGPKTTRASGFTVPLQTGPAAEAASIGLISAQGLLSLQEIEPDGERNRRARRHGLDMMDDLRRLQQGLLGEGVDPELLLRLDRLASTIPPASDQVLRGILEELAVRTRVELARLELVS